MIDAPEPQIFGGLPLLQSYCEFPPCSWKRCAQMDSGRLLELAGFAHMKENEGHLVLTNFPGSR